MMTTFARLGADLVVRMVERDAPPPTEALLPRDVGRVALRGSLLLGAIGLAGGLFGFWLRVQKRDERLRSQKDE